jgi:hypothetical protein
VEEMPAVVQMPEGHEVYSYRVLSVKNKNLRSGMGLRGIHEDNIHLKLFGIKVGRQIYEMWLQRINTESRLS